MKVEFDKYIDEDGFLIMITPTIAFGKENGKWSIGFAWLCFIISIEF